MKKKRMMLFFAMLFALTLPLQDVYGSTVSEINIQLIDDSSDNSSDNSSDDSSDDSGNESSNDSSDYDEEKTQSGRDEETSKLPQTGNKSNHDEEMDRCQ